MRLGMGLRISDFLRAGAAAVVKSTLVNNLVSYWPLNEQSGTRVDVVGANDLTDNNTVGAVLRGPEGTVASFDAASGEYFSTSGAVLDPSADFTLAAWMTHPSGGAGYGTVFAGSPTAQVLMQSPDSGTDAWTLDYRVLTGTPAIVSGATYSGLTPHFITAVWVASTKTLEVFVDGVSAGSASGGGADASATVLWIGKHHGGAQHNGTFSSYGLWNAALDEADITALFASGNGLRYAELTDGLKTGLVSWWELDEVSGVRYDSHGSNDLTDNNTVGSVINAGDAMDGAAASFVAANNESLTLGSAIFTAGEPRSLSVWFKDANDAAANPILTAASTLGNGDRLFDIYTQGSSPNRYVALYGNGGVVSNNTVGLFSYGEWHHLLYTYDGATTHTFYLDGVSRMVESGADGGGADTFAISRSAAGYYNGQLDEVAIWSRVLTEDERAELYAAGAGFFYNTTTEDFE